MDGIHDDFVTLRGQGWVKELARVGVIKSKICRLSKPSVSFLNLAWQHLSVSKDIFKGHFQWG